MTIYLADMGLDEASLEEAQSQIMG